jgi:hypothetical protein
MTTAPAIASAFFRITTPTEIFVARVSEVRRFGAAFVRFETVDRHGHVVAVRDVPAAVVAAAYEFEHITEQDARLHAAHADMGLREIAELVAVTFKLTIEELLGTRRTERCVLPRQAFFALAREYTKLSLVTIGNFARKDHGTVLHAITAVQNRIDTSPLFDGQMRLLRERLAERIRRNAA